MAHWFGVDRDGAGDNRRAQGRAMRSAATILQVLESALQSGPLKEILVVKFLNQRAPYVGVRAVNARHAPGGLGSTSRTRAPQTT